MAAEIRITISQQASGSAAADARKEVQELGEAAKTAGGSFSIFREIGVGALRELGTLGVGLAIDGLKSLAGAVSDGIADARENAKIQAQTAQVIKSTGNAAGVTAEQVASYASSLSAAAGQSLFGDDQIQQSENLLLTFSEIKGHALEAATAISVDMAQALGGAPKDSAIQLGKALNDPIKGITALTRVGVTFTDEQKAQIKTLQESGDMQAAQTVILEELNKEFGGSAAAAAQADGGWAQFNDRMGEAKEAVGTAILPLLGILAGVLNDTIAPAIETVASSFGAWLGDPAVQAQIQAIGAAITEGVGGAFTVLTQTIIPALIGAWNTIAPVIQPVIAGFTDAKTPVQGLLDTLSNISPTFALARAAIEAALPPIRDIVLVTFGIIQGFIQEHGEKIRADLTSAWQQIQAIIAAITPPIQEIISAIFGNIALFLQMHGDEIKAFMASTWDGIASIVNLALQLIQATIVPALQFIAGFISSHGTEIQAILSVVWTNIQGIINIAIAIIKGILQTALALIKGDWQGAWDAIKTMFAAVWENIKTVLGANLEILKAVFLAAWAFIRDQLFIILNGIAGNIAQMMQAAINTITSLGEKLAQAAADVGGAIVSGIVSGISNGASAIADAARAAADAALNAAKHALGISSPSRVFSQQVGGPIAEGIAEGISETTIKVTSAVLDLVDKAISTFAQLGTRLPRVTGAVMQSVMDNLYLLMEQFGELSEGFKGPFIEQAKTFADAVSPVLSAVKAAIDLFTDFPKVARITGKALQVLMDDIYLLMVQFGELSEGFKAPTLDLSKGFAAALSAVVQAIQPAIGLIGDLQDKMGVLTGRQLQTLMNNLYLLMVQFSELSEGFGAAALAPIDHFAAALSAVLRVIQDAIGLLDKLQGYKPNMGVGPFIADLTHLVGGVTSIPPPLGGGGGGANTSATYNQQRSVVVNNTYHNVANTPPMDAAIVRSLANV